MNSAYDVIVIGAGPAGAMAAEAAAKAGCSVLIAEKRAAIGTPLRCAEGIFRQDLEPFIQPDMAWIDAEIRCGVLVAPDGRKVTVTSPDTCGYVLDRKRFDRALIWKAVDAGAEVVVRARAVPLMENGKVAGALITENGVETAVRAKVVIACDGVESQFAKRAGIPTTLPLSGIVTCAEYLVAGTGTPDDTLYFYFSHEYAPGGYAWVFAKGNGRANVGLGIPANQAGDGRRPKEYLDRFVQKLFPQGKIMELVTGGVPVTAPLAKTYADNLLIAGDAAHVADPLTGGGIYQALYTGRLAGETAAAAIAAGNTSAEKLAEYDAAWRISPMGLGLRLSLAGREKYVTLDDTQISQVLAEFADVELEEISVRNVLLAELKARPQILLHIPGLLKLLKK